MIGLSLLVAQNAGCACWWAGRALSITMGRSKSLVENELTTLPEGIFGGLSAMEILYLWHNELTTLPEGIFQNATALQQLSLYGNQLTTLPEGIFGGLTALGYLWLTYNNLTTLPEGIFGGLTGLEYLNLDGNALECLPSTTLVEVDDYASFYEIGLHVDPYGDECGCSIEGVIDNVCGQEACTPGDEGYTCAVTLAPAPAPALGTTAPESTPHPTSVPGSSSEGDASTAGVVVGVVAGALALAALGFFLRRRRVAKSTGPDPSAPRYYAGESLKHGLGEQHQQRQQDMHSSSPIITGSAGGNATRGPPPPTQQDSPPPPPPNAHDGADQRDARPLSPNMHDRGTHQRDARPPAASQQHAAVVAETTFGEDCTPIQSLFPAPPVGALPKSEENPRRRTRDKNKSGGGTRAADSGRGRGGDDAAENGGGCVAAAEQSLLSLTTTNSTADMSTEERTAEVAGLRFSAEGKGDSAPSAAAPSPAAAPAGGRRRTSCGIGYGQAVLAAAEELVHNCQIPGVCEAATAVSILIRLVLDSRDLTSSPGVKRCRSIVTMLQRAAKVVGTGGDTSTEEGRVLMEEVHGAVSDLVELIKTYENKSKLAQMLTSTLFKRRQDELNAVLDRAIWGLHLGLQVQVGHDVAHLVKRSTAEAQDQAESVAEARRLRRRRKLDQNEIPEDHVSITNEMLGKGGFGVVYLADYNGHNAAAKKAERKAFLRELEAMIRLRNPHTVNVYGAITSQPNRLVLVMELLAGGDLRAMLKNSEQPLPEDKCRQIIHDVCAGMAFLHSKATVHGDLKSANVLLDGRGRAKIGDFGTSRWAQNTERSTGLATYTTNPGPSTHISLAWTAPEVLEAKETSKASDVYSFGMVAWEVLTRQTPWADQTRPRDIFLRVVMREERPAIPADAPVDIAEMVRSCWAQEPLDRPTFPVLYNEGNVQPTALSTSS
ncbi:similar to CG1848-PA, isoform A/ leucine rich repeat protein [Ectocarpus siliculosus]|uniref:Similar to CG1848-PA, isoform A/ leucine rich repeat protein n=1 Tax=Ectocarpus siliculosus TaxID=2880 RepID=D7FRQ5_ECTSI|nr:similar to CG1848-PA, isoform A/ leucine rich repeat protein [Ectocarpus siliculosus]|eukprot:CBJ30846.1 similar to CG1848-PA, isoform A/ leucine rich repeat protein [Ectocarpus siliculosus]